MQARQTRTTARHNRTADPLQRFLPTPPDSIRQEQGKPAEGLPSYRASRPCAPPARIHLSMAKNAARCMSPRSTLRCPMHRTPLAIAPHSVGHRTALLSLCQDNPCFCTTVFPHLELRIPGCIKSPPDMQKKPQSETGNHPTPPAPARSTTRNPRFLIATKPISQFKILCSNFPSSAFLNS